MKIKDLFKKVSVANEVGKSLDIKFKVKFVHGEFWYDEFICETYKGFIDYVNSEFNTPWAKALKNGEVFENEQGSYDFCERIDDYAFDVHEMYRCKFIIIKD